MEMIPFLAPLYLSMPFFSGICGASYGRSFWKWVAIGFVLPGISLVLLFWVTRNDAGTPPADL